MIINIKLDKSGRQVSLYSVSLTIPASRLSLGRFAIFASPANNHHNFPIGSIEFEQMHCGDIRLRGARKKEIHKSGSGQHEARSDRKEDSEQPDLECKQWFKSSHRLADTN